MIALYLIIVGLMLIGSHMPLIGLIAIIVGIAASHETARICTIIGGVILLLGLPGWGLAGFVGILIGCLASRR